jgi:hypothetical protein
MSGFGVKKEGQRQQSPRGRLRTSTYGNSISSKSTVEGLATSVKKEFSSLGTDLERTLGIILRNFDLEGRIIKGSPVAIRLSEDGSGETINHNTWTAISFDTVDQKSGSEVTPLAMYSSTAPTKISIIETGWYVICGNAGIEADTGTNRRLAISLSGTEIIRVGTTVDTFTTGAPSSLCVATVAFLSAGQFLQLLIYQSDASSASATLQVGDGEPRFEAVLVAPVVRS